MKYEIKNPLSDIKVDVKQKEDGTVIIYVSGPDEKTLHNTDVDTSNCHKLDDVKPGEVVKIGEREYIVLEHKDGKTAVITKDSVTKMYFGTSGDYARSGVRKYVTGPFYEELCDAVGKENIYLHKVDLMCDDGSNKNDYVEDFISILTTEKYRRYRELIPYEKRWWTATAPTSLAKNYSCRVCYVNCFGAVSWDNCDLDFGVRPFCVLNSSIEVLK